jgi:hypothetical protein
MNKFLTTIGLVIALSGCYNDSYEDLYGGMGGNCDTSNVTFSAVVLPILNQNCALSNCHKTGSALGGYMLDNYAGAKAAEGRIIGAITHSSGFSPMPKNLPMLSDCDITKISIWVAQGAPNN